MRVAGEVTTRVVEGAVEGDIPASEVYREGRASGTRVSGAILEAAVQWQDRCYLLFLTDDVPQEDMLSIHLLDDRLKLLDSAVIGSPYSTGSFTSLELREPNTVRFRFIGETTWSVELLPRPVLRLPCFSEPRGVRRAFGFSRHFLVRGNPNPG